MDNKELLEIFKQKRPHFKSKAVITGGMPYGNKLLHIGHIGGVFIPADIFARFMRDRIGKENVVFVSGTDCFGSPIAESYRILKEKGEFNGTLLDYVTENHNKQKAILDNYDISLNLYAGSAIDRAGEIHQELSNEIFTKLYNDGYLEKMSTLQFYDEKRKTFLNGRQVIGKCPIDGCTSEKAYADECSMGHQYMPHELINPVSTLSGETPVLKESENYYFKLPEFCEEIIKWADALDKTPMRKFAIKEIKEFLKKPEIYIKREYFDKVKALNLPKYELIEDNKASFTIVFDKLTDREKACDILSENEVRYRTGKTLVPFRLTSNLNWGVKVPEINGIKDLTFWVWPESLWAPISFTETYLESINSKLSYKDFWENDDCAIYQFIGEDNLSFYGPCEVGLWFALQGKNYSLENAKNGNLIMPSLIPVKHILYFGKKASSSSTIKPPMAHELLDYYTNEQLRAHFIGLNSANVSASFCPKVLNKEDKTSDADPVCKEGNLFTNVLNRIARTFFYTIEKYGSIIPQKPVSEDIIVECQKNCLDYEKLMYEQKFHMVSYLLDTLIRNINKNWVKQIKEIEENNNTEKLNQLLVDTAYYLKTALLLTHPITPTSTEDLKEYLRFNDKVFDWKYIYEDLDFFVSSDRKVKVIPPKFDFYKKHPSQFEE